jgi:enterochelin esterase-like enzyme
MKYVLALIAFIISNCSFGQLPEVVSGKIVRISPIELHSSYLRDRNVDVWLPDGYDTSKKYAVLYLHDGQQLFDGKTTFNKQEWGIDESMTELIRTGKIKETIVVGIWNTPDRRLEYYPAKAFNYLSKSWQDSLRKDVNLSSNAKPKSDDYLKYIVRELKPYIDRNFSTYSDRANTFIGGSSMGGLISLYALCEYPKVFGGAICISTHWPSSVFRNEPQIADAMLKYMRKKLPKAKKHKLYFDFGTATLDAWYEPYQRKADDIMRKKKYDSSNWKTRKFEGAAHDENAWRGRLPIPLSFMLAP